MPLAFPGSPRMREQARHVHTTDTLGSADQQIAVVDELAIDALEPLRRPPNRHRLRRAHGNLAKPMALIRIEPEPPIKEQPCATCRGVNRLMHGYVYDSGNPHGIYILEWCDGDHPSRAAFLTVGLGRFEDGTGREDRHSFCIEWTATGMYLADEPARDRPELLGDFLPRDRALAFPDIAAVWHVIDHIVLDDPRAASVRQWLEDLPATP
jgi:hypothetical protein